MSVIKFETKIHSLMITLVVVERATDHSVWINRIINPQNGKTATKRFAKHTNHRNFYDTWEEAQASLIEYYTEKVQHLQKKTEDHLKTITKIKEMTKPDYA